MLLPETLNKDLPESIEDGENFGKYVFFMIWICSWCKYYILILSFFRETEEGSPEEEKCLQEKELAVIKIENGDAVRANGTLLKENGKTPTEAEEYKDEISWRNYIFWYDSNIF